MPRGIECCLEKYGQRKAQLPKREKLSSGFLLGHCMKGAWDSQEGREGDKVLVTVLVKCFCPWLTGPKSDPYYLHSSLCLSCHKNHGNMFLKWGARGFKPHSLPNTQLLMTSYRAQASSREPCSCVPQFTKSSEWDLLKYLHTHSTTSNLEYSCTWSALHTPLHPEIPRTTLGSPESNKGRCEHRGELPNESQAAAHSNTLQALDAALAER